jgi:CheY-like chemotaxis protein
VEWQRMKKILLIDDMKGIRDSLEVILSSTYALDVVDNAQGGLVKIESTKYDLIITDIIMPGMDGNEFIIRAKQKVSCPILAISAGGNGASPDQALMLARQQATDVLIKPFSKNDLIEKIEQLMR